MADKAVSANRPGSVHYAPQPRQSLGSHVMVFVTSGKRVSYGFGERALKVVMLNGKNVLQDDGLRLRLKSVPSIEQNYIE